jgi:hypothetical protein
MKCIHLTTLTAFSLLLHWGAPSRVIAQTSTFETGTIYTIPGVATSQTTGRAMNGMLVSWTMGDGSAGSATWSTWSVLGVEYSGIRWSNGTSGLELSIGPDANTFSADWSLSTFGFRLGVYTMTFNGAPGRTLFDCAWTGTACASRGQPSGATLPGTPGSSSGLSGLNGPYYGNPTFRYSNAVQVGSAPPVGDLFEQLTIDFAKGMNVLGARSYLFRIDTDNSLLDQPLPTVASATTTVPEPGSLVLVTIGLGGLGIMSRHRRRRTAFAS